MLMMLVTGCAIFQDKTIPNDSAVCDGLRPLAKDHAATLADSPHDPSVLTGAKLLSAFKDGCRDG